MRTLEENIFVVGAVVTGDSFFGREAMLSLLESAVIAGVGSRHLVGPTRIGKTSLVEQLFLQNKDTPNRLFVQINLGYCENAYDFWTTLTDAVRDQLEEKGLWNEDFTACYERIDNLPGPENEGWWRVYRGQVIKIMAAVKERGFRLVLAIDEFDAVVRVFGQRSVYFQLLRSICSEPKFATSGILISRRRLQLLEAICPDISTFHGVFPEMTLLPFSAEDLEAFYQALDLYDVKVSAGGKKRLARYTGHMPYLCCLFAEQMVAGRGRVESYGDKEMEAIFKQLLPQIDRHYEDLIERLEEDGHTDFIFYLSIGAKVPNLTPRDLENLTAMGTLLSETEDGKPRYYVFSHDFMTYFRLRPL
ncbi:MAG: ATP-binding protein, partial [Clostridia bacterium]|nr:ATP-binding protein [Clostridia bacterium]